MKKLFLFLSVATLSLGSCTKKDETPAVIAYCVSDSFNGTFAATPDPITQVADEVKVTKTSCTTLTLNTPDGEKKVSEVNASSGNGVTGKIGSEPVALSLDGNTIGISGAFVFSGTRK